MVRVASLSLFLAGILLAASPGFAQDAPTLEPPEPSGDIVPSMRFETPTLIAGRLLTFDTYDPAIWILWTHVYDGGRWVPVPSEPQLLVYPRNPGMMDFFRRLRPGTAIRMTIQADEDGKRRVVELEGA
ncbi:MAG: hypothetical protein AB1411_03890 [Nitrospirota bacterium]